MTNLPPDDMPMAEALEAARNIGDARGNDAASWVFDGNTDDACYARMLKGIDEGDPAILDSVREPSFSGEYSCDYSERDLCEEIGISYDLSTTEEVDEIADAYLDQARAVFWSAIEIAARKHLGE